MLNWHQSAFSFLEKLKVSFISSNVSPGIPSMKEVTVCIPVCLQSSKAFTTSCKSMPLLSFCWILGEPDSTPKNIVWQPADFISDSNSLLMRSARVSQVHFKSILLLLIRRQSSDVRFLL